MVFSNLTFLYIFLPLNLLLYFISKNATWRNAVLLAFSLVFYAWGEPICVILLVFSAAVAHQSCRVIGRFPGSILARMMLVGSLVVMLGSLGIFKYSGFFVENINAITGLGLSVPQLALPIGISFYTFQIISYIVDVYRGQVEAQPSFFKFLMYVSMYPQLVAGPIVRYSDVIQEIDNRTITVRGVSNGITRFCVGLCKKVLVANYAGELSNVYLKGDFTYLSTPEAWVGLLFFTLQIYYDFSAYSDMAIGLGNMFGFHFRENFNYPYISGSITEFWRRWHISLSSFFRDYVYIPLGGNRHHYVRNLLMVWFLTGLWHGASWNFILWGLYFGLLILLERKVLFSLLQRLPAVVRIAYSMFFVTLGWAIFYFTDMTRLAKFLQILFGGGAAGTSALQITLINNVFWLVLAVIFCLPLTRLVQQLIRHLCSSRTQLAASWIQTVVNAIVLLACTAMLVGQSYNPFLYFRF